MSVSVLPLVFSKITVSEILSLALYSDLSVTIVIILLSVEFADTYIPPSETAAIVAKVPSNNLLFFIFTPFKFYKFVIYGIDNNNKSKEKISKKVSKYKNHDQAFC